MRWSVIFIAIGVAGMGAYFVTSAKQEAHEASAPYVIEPGYSESLIAARALENWRLSCQGCHRPDGSGLAQGGMPDLRGKVSKFVHTEAGREYLGRVPGVTNNSIPDDELAELVNWLLYTFDPDSLPHDFVPYSTDEISALRQQPLGSEASDMRAHLLSK